jgi:hypothetical protein
VSDNLSNKSINVWRAIKKGGVVIGVLISASAAADLILDQFEMTPSQWLATWIRGYQSIFFQIIDRTLGRVASLFSFEIMPLGKNVIVLYSVFGAALARRMYKTDVYLRSKLGFEEFNLGLSWWMIAIAYLLWPVFIIAVLFNSIFNRDPGLASGSRRDLKGFLLELIVVALVVFVFVFGDQLRHHLAS